jgi:hypothetical protein
MEFATFLLESSSHSAWTADRQGGGGGFVFVVAYASHDHGIAGLHIALHGREPAV